MLVVVCAIILIAVVLLSFLKEIKRFEFIWNRFPTLMIFIPTWSFFAPIPNMFDYYVVYRTMNNSNELKEWKQAFKINNKRPWFAFIWNPEKKLLKAFLDLVRDLVAFSNRVQDKRQICTSVPYLQILNYVNSLNHEEATEKVQFIILGNSRLYNHEVVFTSELHPLVKA